MRIVIAVGGNALLKENQRGTWADQLDSARPVAGGRRGAAPRGPSGRARRTATARRSARSCSSTRWASRRCPALPLHALGAMTQGELGYLLQTSIAEIDPERADRDDPDARARRRRRPRVRQPDEAGRPVLQRGGRPAPVARARLGRRRGLRARLALHGRQPQARRDPRARRDQGARRERRDRHRRRRRRHPRRARAAATSPGWPPSSTRTAARRSSASRSASTSSCC